MNFYAESIQGIHDYARLLLNENRDKQQTFEDIAQYVVKRIYNDFEDEHGEKLFALVRIFKMVREIELPPEGLDGVEQSDQWLALMSTMGQEDDWNNRLTSVGHRLLPSGAFETPMLKATFEQLGIRGKSDGEFMQQAGFMSNYFHVEHADDSPFIVVQDEFVKAYGIKSVVGLGSPFANGSMYILLGFAKSSLTQADAEKFSKLAPFIGTLLASYSVSDHPIWNSKAS